MIMKNLRKDATLGIILLAVWLVIKLIFQGSGFFLTLLLIAGIVMVVVGFLPDDLHKRVMDAKNKLLAKIKK